MKHMFLVIKALNCKRTYVIKKQKKNPEAARGKSEMWTAGWHISEVLSIDSSKMGLDTPLDFDYR